jgi:ribosome-associated protein
VKLVKRKSDTPEFYADVRRIAATADEHKAIDVKAYDVREVTLVADAFVLCSAASEPQMKAIHSSVLRDMREVGRKPLQVEGDSSGGWLLLDYGNIVFHVFREEARAYYDLDGLWGDAPEVPLSLEGATRGE